MSTYWNVCCFECGSEAGCLFECSVHREDLMIAVCEGARSLAKIAKVATASGLDVRLDTSIGGADLEWFLQHAEHMIVPIDEYGQFRNLCGVRMPDGRTCDRQRGHADGDHDGPPRRT